MLQQVATATSAPQPNAVTSPDWNLLTPEVADNRHGRACTPSTARTPSSHFADEHGIPSPTPKTQTDLEKGTAVSTTLISISHLSIQIFIWLSLYSCISFAINPLIHSLNRWLAPILNSFRTPVSSFIHPILHQFVCQFFYPPIHSALIHLLLNLLIYLSTYPSFCMPIYLHLEIFTIPPICSFMSFNIYASYQSIRYRFIHTSTIYLFVYSLGHLGFHPNPRPQFSLHPRICRPFYSITKLLSYPSPATDESICLLTHTLRPLLSLHPTVDASI